MEDLFFAGFFMAMMAFAFMVLAFGIVVFVLQAIGLFKIAKREGKGNIAWLAWIPVVSAFLIPYLVEKDVHPGLRGKFTLVYGIAVLMAVMFAYFLPFAPFIPMGIMLYAFYFIASKYSANPVFHTAIGIATIGCSVPIQIFMIRNGETTQAATVVKEV